MKSIRMTDQKGATLPLTEDRVAYIDVKRCALEVIDGPERGVAVDPLPLRTLIGRQPFCDLELTDPRVSAVHGEISLSSGRALLRDLGSTNGISYAGARVNELWLKPGASFRLGNTTLRFTEREGMCSHAQPVTDPAGALIGRCPAMRRLFDMIARVARHDIPVLLLGETGSGKTAVARVLHEMSPRAHRPFVAINCAALPASLIESTLFGHVKGSFTGAHADAPGLLAQARGGTVLLDEVSEMPLDLQPKLLQALESGWVRPVGGDAELAVDFRVVATSNRRLRAEAEQQRFRQDLYYRLAGIELLVPALRDRREDLPLLVERLAHKRLGTLVEAGGDPRFCPEVLALLEAHPWPGNVRELDNVVQRAAALAGAGPIHPEHIIINAWDASRATAHAGEARSRGSFDLPFKDFKEQVFATYEREYLRKLLERSQGNLSLAARLAGLSRTHLATLLRRHEA